MLNSGTNIHSLAYTITLMLLAASIPLSKFTMSVTEFMLLGLWLWSGFSFRVSYRFFKIGGFFKGIIHLVGYIIALGYNNIIDKFTLFFRNKPALVFTFIYMVHVIGLLYTSDMSYAVKDLRVKVPLLLLPVVISTMHKLNPKQFRLLLTVFSLSVLSSTIVSIYIFLADTYVDIREISPFISPIRLGLNVSFSFFIMIYFIFHEKKFNTWQIISFIIMALWFLSFLFLLEAVTSIVIILIGSIGYLFFRVLNTMVSWQKLALLLFVIALPTVFILHVRGVIIDARTAPNIDFGKLDVTTNLGNEYTHDTIKLKVEDGRYVGLYLCYDELITEWNNRSEIDYYGVTDAGHMVNATLVRYLTSHDLRKDAEGVKSLTDDDIFMIEHGVANYNYIHSPGLKTRLLKMIMGYEVYQQTNNPSGSSVMQRYEYIRASFKIINDNFLFGVGTGDLENAFYEEFTTMNSALESQYRYHAHNQFLGIFVAFGFFGFLVFIVGMFYPAIVLSGFKDYYFSIFFIIMIVSMFSDDTIETQAGATLFAFFYSLLLFGRKKGENMPASITK
jgi:hypothetical protein